jgi:hypothetical protein
MSGFAGEGRLQDAEWILRACMIMNRELPEGAPEYSETTELNAVYTSQAAGFEELLEKIDPESEINPHIFPILNHFSSSENWPLDIILASIAALFVWLFMDNYYGIFKYVAYMTLASYVVIQYLRPRRDRQRAEREMVLMGLDPHEPHPLTLRMLVRYRKRNLTFN